MVSSENKSAVNNQIVDPTAHLTMGRWTGEPTAKL